MTTFARRAASAAVSLGPGLALALCAVAVANLANRLAPQVSTFGIAVVLGVIVANLPNVPAALAPGTTFAAKRLLRIGIMLLGFRLVLTDVLAVGLTGLLVVAVVVATTFFGTQWLGRRMGLSPGFSLLIATGYSICGLSAIAAVAPVSGAKREETALSVGLVTLFGTLAMFTLPLVGGLLGLDGGAFGAWVGASVHDVAQVIAAASMGGDDALEAAVLVKLTRVVLLAPLVAGISIVHRRSVAADETSPRLPLVPFFVVGFLAAVIVRTTGIVPAAGLSAIEGLVKLLLTAALFGLGAGVKIAKLRGVGGRGLVLGAVAWLAIAGVSYVAVQIAGGLS